MRNRRVVIHRDQLGGRGVPTRDFHNHAPHALRGVKQHSPALYDTQGVGAFLQGHLKDILDIQRLRQLGRHAVQQPQAFGLLGQVLRAAARIGEQPRIFQRHRRLVREGQHQLGIGLGIKTRLHLVQRHQTNDLALAHQRRAQPTAGRTVFRRREPVIQAHVRHVHRQLVRGNVAEQHTVFQGHHQPDEFGSSAIIPARRGNPQIVGFAQPQRHAVVLDHIPQLVQHQRNHLIRLQRGRQAAGDRGQRGQLLRTGRQVGFQPGPFGHILNQQDQTRNLRALFQRVQVVILDVVAPVRRLARHVKVNVGLPGIKHLAHAIVQQRAIHRAIVKNMLTCRVFVPAVVLAHGVVVGGNTPFAAHHDDTLLDGFHDRAGVALEIDHLLVQAGIFHCNRGLRGKDGRSLNFVKGEITGGFGAHQDQHAQGHAFTQQRHAHVRTRIQMLGQRHIHLAIFVRRIDRHSLLGVKNAHGQHMVSVQVQPHPNKLVSARPHPRNTDQPVTLQLPDIGAVHVQDFKTFTADALQGRTEVQGGVQLVTQAHQSRREALAFSSLLVEPRVFHCHRTEVRHALHQQHRLFVKAIGAAQFAPQGHHANHPTTDHHRQHHQAALACLPPAAQIVGRAIREFFAQVQHPALALGKHLAQERPLRRNRPPRPDFQPVDIGKGCVYRVQIPRGGVVLGDGHARKGQEALQTVCDGSHDTVDVQRAGHGLHHLVEQGFLFRRAAGFLVEAGSLDGAGRLAGEQRNRAHGGLAGGQPAHRAFHADQTDQIGVRAKDGQDHLIVGVPARRIGSFGGLPTPQVLHHPGRIMPQVKRRTQPHLIKFRLREPAAQFRSSHQPGMQRVLFRRAVALRNQRGGFHLRVTQRDMHPLPARAADPARHHLQTRWNIPRALDLVRNGIQPFKHVTLTAGRIHFALDGLHQPEILDTDGRLLGKNLQRLQGCADRSPPINRRIHAHQAQQIAACIPQRHHQRVIRVPAPETLSLHVIPLVDEVLVTQAGAPIRFTFSGQEVRLPDAEFFLKHCFNLLTAEHHTAQLLKFGQRDTGLRCTPETAQFFIKDAHQHHAKARSHLNGVGDCIQQFVNVLPGPERLPQFVQLIKLLYTMTQQLVAADLFAEAGRVQVGGGGFGSQCLHKRFNVGIKDTGPLVIHMNRTDHPFIVHDRRHQR